MNINKTNYGSWFLDYYEGTLVAEQVAELFLFLQQHPELREEFESFEHVTLHSASVSFDGKEQLKRGVITNTNIDHYLVSELEGDLTLKDRIQLKDFLRQHPDFEKDRVLYSLTKANPITEVFPAKNNLKKRVVRPFYTQVSVWTAVAATLLIVAGILYINNPRLTEQVVRVDDESIKTPDVINNNRLIKENDTDSNAAEHKNKVTPSPLIAKTNPRKPKVENDFSPKRIDGRQDFQRLVFDEISLVERKGITAIFHREVEEPFLQAIAHESANQLASSPKISPRKSMEDKLDDFKNNAVDKINSAAGQDILLAQDKSPEINQQQGLPFKSRILKLFASLINSASGDRVQMTTSFDASGNIAAYEVTAGKFRYERDF